VLQCGAISAEEEPAAEKLSSNAPAVITPPEEFFLKFRDRDREAARKFYKKYLDVKGLSVAASADVDDLALQRTYDIVTHLLAGRPDILQAMVKNGTRLIIIGKDQVYTDMPEYRNHPNPAYQNERVRGTGGLDVTSFGEENLLNLPLDRYDDESIALHEFCHTIDAALGRIDPTWRKRLVQTYKSAVDKGLWKNAYTSSNPAEYWAEICQSYFDCNRINNWNHAAIGTREQLKQYDPEGYELVRTTFKLTPATDWRYQPLLRQPSVIPPPARFKFDPYYMKFTYAREFPVLGSKHVSDESLLRANDIIRKLFAYRHDILKAIIADGARLVVLGRGEKLSDLPELQKHQPEALARLGPDTGASLTHRAGVPEFDLVRYLDYESNQKLMVVPEENVLCLASDPFAGKCMVVGVFARALYHVAGTRPVDPEFERRRGKQQYELRVKRLDIEFDHRLQKLHESALSKGLWKGTAAARDRVEYWSAGVESYFDAAGAGQAPNLADRPITTRELLSAYDPDLFALVDETMAYREHVDWRFSPHRVPDAKEQKSNESKSSEASSPTGVPRYAPSPKEIRESYQRAQAAGRSLGKVYKAQIIPHWFHDNTRFWYRNDFRGGDKEFILVDAERGTRQPAFDHQKLAAGLSKAAQTDYQAQKLPFNDLQFPDDNQVQFRIGDKTWQCDLTTYECSQSATSSILPNIETGDRILEMAATDRQPPEIEPSPRIQSNIQRAPSSSKSPDGKWTAFIKDNNVFVRASEDGQEMALSQDGKHGLAYGLLQWSPDSKTLVAFRIEPGDIKDVYLIESSPKGGGRAKLRTRPYALPGDKFTAYEVNLFDVETKKQIKPDVERIDFGFPQLHWNHDGHRFTYQKVDRGHQRFRLVEIDTQTGKSRNLIDESSNTFIWTAHTEMLRLQFVNYLEASDEIIYVSERDGWRHLYLIDGKKGKIKNQITKGEYVIRGIDRIDADKRQVWFQASGKIRDQDPYFIQCYRVNFDGSDLVALTEGNGNHTIQLSPDRKHLIDTYSRVDMPPIQELRRTSDGKLLCKLEEADISELKENGWAPPEVFVAKGRDGKTDIWGIICRPQHFDPAKKYPVIEQIYAGPHGSFVPKSFSPSRRFASLTELGFIVVQIDGMGTANRSKAFHNVCWHNIKDAGFPDRIVWHQAVAKKYPYYDLDRVGIYGGSAGGQNATAGVLFHPEFYKVAVSGCGCHDNRMDKASWNEQWMGYPVGPQYAECSNIDNAHRLRGKLLLIVGELDNNVPPESTLRLVDALIKAGKDFEFLMVPGAGHGMGGAYGNPRLQDFFVRHLHGVEPPDRNSNLSLTQRP
jgi:dipeptidyl aminopeptidase/acylaminoacyl peptidase